MKEIIIYTDGACSGNPGPGGWAAILMFGEHKKEISGGELNTTNNRMELQAAIESLKSLKEPCSVKLYSDSAYLVNCFQQGWYKGWIKNGWKNSKKQPVENKDQWEQLLELVDKHKVEFVKVKGHANNELNNRCDELAVAAVPR
ncbi:ribonuclease HI [Ammoniphilus resinae]|uniref:Ribonuclease H n=1 Tax=Ammoniphilus resinae TaxID=861532 RepID=A0ABS4GJ28_9BACL|nr:ribonuclease HI [Ammoniphilus resinae]MBP1930264.1 ribonuclease HI [Ammoniphilus resinae]